VSSRPSATPALDGGTDEPEQHTADDYGDRELVSPKRSRSVIERSLLVCAGVHPRRESNRKEKRESLSPSVAHPTTND
jgi:hypothetical protein